MFKYYVSFSFGVVGVGFGFGHTTIDLDSRLDTEEKIEELHEFLQFKGFPKANILSFQLLSETPASTEM